jgi:hypothetical protein
MWNMSNVRGLAIVPQDSTGFPIGPPISIGDHSVIYHQLTPTDYTIFGQG